MSYHSVLFHAGRRSLLRAGLAALLAATALVAHPGPAASAATIEVTDLAGHTVRVRKGVDKVVLGEGRQLYTVAMLDRDDPFRRVVGWGDDLIKNDPDTWRTYLAKFPHAEMIARLGNPSAADVSLKTILSLGAELYVLDLSNTFKARETGLIEKLEGAGVPTLLVDFRPDPTRNALLGVLLLGEVFDREREAAAFADYYPRQTRRLFTRAGSVPEDEKPPVFVERAAGHTPCCATFGRTNFGRFVEEAGGRNRGSRHVAGFSAQAAPERVLADDPDVYFVTGGNWGPVSAGSAAVPLGYDATPEVVQARLRALTERPGFPRMKAVGSKRVMTFYHQFYDAPYHFVAELAMAKMLHPDRFRDVDPVGVFEEVHERCLPIAYSGVFWARLR